MCYRHSIKKAYQKYSQVLKLNSNISFCDLNRRFDDDIITLYTYKITSLFTGIRTKLPIKNTYSGLRTIRE